MGPWRHGGWARSGGTYLGNVFFSDDPPPSEFYRKEIEFPFFQHYLNGASDPGLPEAYVFETGKNKWRTFENWPPKNTEPLTLYLHSDGGINDSFPGEDQSYREFISDPAKPVPFTETITTRMPTQYMTDDQRFASRRPDVLVYQTAPLQEEVTIAGKIMATLQASTDQSDADWILKLVDVYPDDFESYPHQPDKPMGGYQQMVRSEAFRGRFRNSYSNPEPFIPGRITRVEFPLQDVLHTFKKGHRIMIQVQSTWFPIIDRNPQKWVDNIYNAVEEDFVKATHRIWSGSDSPTLIQLNILK
jgi:putative CocE/NonD family hydrolase